ncbi:MAG: lysine biosynthesis protein LysW [archaeon]|nr:lysine biosynthesis protein LysW [archaeon]
MVFISSICPECEANVNFKDSPIIREVIECNDCGSQLIVVATDPIKLEVSEETGEDWGE